MELTKQIFELVYNYIINMQLWQLVLLYVLIGAVVGGVSVYLYCAYSDKSPDWNDSDFLMDFVVVCLACCMVWPFVVGIYIIYRSARGVSEFMMRVNNDKFKK